MLERPAHGRLRLRLERELRAPIERTQSPLGVAPEHPHRHLEHIGHVDHDDVLGPANELLCSQEVRLQLGALAIAKLEVAVELQLADDDVAHLRTPGRRPRAAITGRDGVPGG